MYVVLMIVNLFIPLSSTSRLWSVIDIIIFAGIGALTYFICTYKSGVIDEIFGKDIIKKILKKVLRK